MVLSAEPDVLSRPLGLHGRLDDGQLRSLTASATRAHRSTGPMRNPIPTYAIIPTNGRVCFGECLDAIYDFVDRVFVIEGGPDARYLEGDFTVIREPEINISKWWNLGLSVIADRAREEQHPRWNVVVLNDDAIVDPMWVSLVSGQMREAKAAAASTGNPNPYPILHTQPGPVNLSTRLQGFAFMLAGEKGVRANEQIKWYFSDDHVDWLSRQHGGMLSIPGGYVRHLYPNSQVTAALQEQIARDAAAFTAYWNGMRPW